MDTAVSLAVRRRFTLVVSNVSSGDAGRRRPCHLGANVPFGTGNFVVAVTTTFLANGKVDTRLLDTVALSHPPCPYRCLPILLGAPRPPVPRFTIARLPPRKTPVSFYLPFRPASLRSLHSGFKWRSSVKP